MAQGGVVGQGIIVQFGANIAGLTAGATGASGMLESFGKIGATAGLAVAAGVAVGAVAVTKMSGDFQQLMTKLTTTADESTDKIKMVGQGILDMSTQTATGALKLGDAMYWIESGGAHAQTALDDLRIAAMGAKAENANLDDVAKALMFTLNNFGSTGLTAAQAMNTLIAGVGQGEMTLQGLSGAISNVMPTARTFGISLTDIVAGLDTMTKQGDNASQAATHLAMMIKTIEAPSKAGSSALHSIGLTTQQVTDEMRKSLPGAIDMIVTAMKKKFPEGSTAYNEALKAISGGSRSMAAIMETSGTQMDTFRNAVDAINKAVKAGGNSITGWSDVQQNFNFKMDAAKASLEKVGIEIGTKLLPVAGRLMDFLASPGFATFATTIGTGMVNAVSSLVNGLTTVVNIGTSVTNFFKNNQVAGDALIGVIAGISAVVLIFAAMAIPALVAGFVAWAVAAGAAAIATIAATWPILLIGAVVAAVVFGIIEAVQHWGAIVAWFQGIWAAFSSWFMGIMGAIGAFVGMIVSNIVGFFQSLPGRAIAAARSLGGMLMNFWNGLKSDAINAGTAIIRGLADAITGAIGYVTTAITNVTSWISAHLPHSPAKVGPLRDLQVQGMEVSNQISKGMINGTPLITSAMSNLLKPINVKANYQYPKAAASSTPQVIVQVTNQPPAIYLDSRELAPPIAAQVANMIRRNGNVRSH